MIRRRTNSNAPKQVVLVPCRRLDMRAERYTRTRPPGKRRECIGGLWTTRYQMAGNYTTWSSVCCRQLSRKQQSDIGVHRRRTFMPVTSISSQDDHCCLVRSRLQFLAILRVPEKVIRRKSHSRVSDAATRTRTRCIRSRSRKRKRSAGRMFRETIVTCGDMYVRSGSPSPSHRRTPSIWHGPYGNSFMSCRPCSSEKANS